MSRELVIDQWKMQGIDWMHCEEDDDKILHIKDHSFAVGDFEVQGKKVINIYVCKECGMHAIFTIPKVKEGQTIRGTIMPFASGDALKAYLDGEKRSDMFSDFYFCDEMIAKDILE